MKRETLSARLAQEKPRFRLRNTNGRHLEEPPP
jgi:hypothetical protein